MWLIRILLYPIALFNILKDQVKSSNVQWDDEETINIDIKEGKDNIIL